MSHSHTHAPGEEHSHSHGPQQPQPQPQMPQPDPAMQALIDQDYIPSPLTLSADNANALCSAHKLEKCDDCNVDFINVNRLSRLLVANPNLLCPPPSNIVSQKLTQMVVSTKDEGNVLFKAGNALQAVAKYTTAASLAVQRPPWEDNRFMREELSTAISNRSAAYFDLHDYISALADAETVISIRRNWSKGHFRKAKALLGLGRYREAADAVRLGLDFEPTSNELLSFLADIERVEKRMDEKKLEARQAKTEPVSS
uniref:Translocation protein sec72 n=1 Tax=Psilocybe cubensis TaxID=181762 RepID=A0A8H7XW02_PSICU